jgi:hypothetical protein
MDKLEIEEERKKLMQHYGQCILIIEHDGSVMVAEPDGKKYTWDTDDSMRYNGYFRNVLARSIFKEVIIKE